MRRAANGTPDGACVATVGDRDGAGLGARDGRSVGLAVGGADGPSVGECVGRNVGGAVGGRDGRPVGPDVVGARDGLGDGGGDGCAVGARVCLCDGE